MTVEFTHWSDWICEEHVDEVSIGNEDKPKWSAFYKVGPTGRNYARFVGATPREAVEKYIAWYATKCLTKD